MGIKYINNTGVVGNKFTVGEAVIGEHAVHSGYYGLWNTEAIVGTTGQYMIISAGTDTFINGDNVYIRAGNNSGTNQVKLSTSGGLTVGGNRVLTVADEGSGNGLDADTLDGNHASAFLTSYTETDTLATVTGRGASTTTQLFFDAGFDSHPIMLSGAQNFDNIDRSGFYNLYNTHTSSTNSPGFHYGTMIAIGNDKGSSGFGLQIAHERTGAGFYVRGMNDSGSTWYDWDEIWTSGTHGSGSGLDADTLDSYEASAFPRKAEDAAITGNYDFSGTGLKLSSHFYTRRYDANGNVYFHVGTADSVANILNLRVYDASNAVKTLVLNGGTGAISWNGNTILTTADEGSGNGLDADTVDGVEADSLQKITYQETHNANDYDASSGTWSTGENSSWGTSYKIGDAYAYNDGTGMVKYNVPSGYKTAYIAHMKWSTGGHFDVYAEDSSGNLILRGRFSSHQDIENSNHSGNHDGQTVIKISGLGGMSSLRIQNRSGRIHLQGIGWTKEEFAETTDWGTNWNTILNLPGTIWHSNNDGSGSTLDADTVDGVEASAIVHGSNTSGTNEGTITNWNSVDKSGFYSDDNASNSWTTGWTSIINHRLYDNDNNYHSQIGFGTYGSEMYYRGKHGAVNGWSNWQRIFMDDYHPNADEWTTARTITFSGDVTGSFTTSGASDSSCTLTVANDSHTHDTRYIVKGGSWYGSNFPGSRWNGFNVNGGEIVFARDNPNNGQMSILVDGAYYAGENNGFYSIYSGNNYNNRVGFYGNSSGHFYITTTNVKADGNTIWHQGNDGSGSTLDADLLDGEEGSYYTNASNLSSGTIPEARLPEFIEEKYIFTSDGSAVYMPMVKSGMYSTTSSSVTGQILIKLPSYKSRMMMQFYVDIYEYTTGESMTFRISGYNYNDTSAQWINTSVVNLSDDTDRDFTVRFGADTTNEFQYVTIGETNSTWSYPQVNVRDFYGGFNTSASDAQGSFDVSFVTTTPGTVQNTHTGNFVATDWGNIANKPSTFAPSTHNHDDRYYTETESDARFLRGDTSDAMAGRLTLNTGGTNTYGLIAGYGNDNHFITMRGKVTTGTSTLTVTGGHQMTFVEHADAADEGWYFVSKASGNYTEMARIDGVGQMYIGGNKVWHQGNDGSGSGLDADTVDGLEVHTGTNNEANKIVRTQANGYIHAGWINTTSGSSSADISRIYASNDGYIRYYTPGNFLNGGGIAEDLFNHQTRSHSAVSNFNDTVLRAGVNYINGGTNGPTGSGQWYGFRLGLGGNYGTATGSSGHYASELYWGRKGQTSNNYYLYSRDLENGTWGSWVKMNAGEADAWTTARTITLGGDLTGSVSIDGSANVTLSAQVTNNSHQHSQLYENSTITYGGSYLQWTDLSGTGGTGLNGAAPGNPFSDWHHHIIMNHANSNGYYVDIASSFHYDRVHFRRNTGGTLGTWREFFHTGNDGAGSGLDADTLDGMQSKSASGATSGEQIIRSASNNYIYHLSWIDIGTAGLYSTTTNGSHLYPNAVVSHGSWRMNGTRGGYNGIVFDTSSVYTSLLSNASNTGFYNATDGEWMLYGTRNAGVKLFFDGSEKLETVTGGVNVTGTMTASADVVAYSDERLKSNIETLDGSKVYKMRGVSFTKDEKDGSGVIAQELEKVAPELVNNDSEFKSVAYGNITGYLIEAIKDLKQEIEELKKQIK